MWFGDLVTMRGGTTCGSRSPSPTSWAAFSQVEATRFTDGWITFANRRKAWAYRADQLPSTHPVVADIHDLRGRQAQLRRHHLRQGRLGAQAAGGLRRPGRLPGGRPALLQAARVRQHPAGRPAVGAGGDLGPRHGGLVAVLAADRGRQLADPGGLVRRRTAPITELAVLQGAAARRTPSCARTGSRSACTGAAPGAGWSATRAPRPTWPGRAPWSRSWPARTRPELVLVNDEDLTYCKIRFDDASLATLRAHLGDIADPLARALAWSAVWNMTRDGLMPARDYLDLVLRFAGRESDIGVLQMLHDLGAQPRWTTTARPSGTRRAAAALAEGALAGAAAAEPGSGHQLAWARFFAAVASSDADLAAAARTARRRRDDRRAGGGPGAALGVPGTAGRARRRRRVGDRGGARPGRHRLGPAAPGALSGGPARPRWSRRRPGHDVVESDTLSNALVEATIAGFAQPGQRELLAPYTERYFAAVDRLWTERSIEIGMAVVRGLFPSFEDRDGILEADRRVAGRPHRRGTRAAAAGPGGAGRPGPRAARPGMRRRRLTARPRPFAPGP